MIDEQAAMKSREDQKALMSQCQQIDRQLQGYYGRFWQLKLQFNDPEAGFDRSRVLGRLFSLFSVRDSKHVVAIEMIAGARLNNIVVDTQHTAKLLLKSDAFRSHVNLLPLNKIQGQVMRDNVLRDNVTLAE